MVKEEVEMMEEEKVMVKEGVMNEEKDGRL